MKMGFITQVPPGTHHAAFEGVELSSHREYGAGVRWIFRIDDGEYSGVIVGRTTKDVASENNSCGKFWMMVSGLSFEVAIQHDTDDWVNDVGTIAIESAPSGSGVRVTDFVRDNQNTPF